MTTETENHLRRRIREAALALVFLTRLPLRLDERTAARPLFDGLWAFPLVGLVVGGLGGLTLWGAAFLGWHPLASAFAALASQMILTGALHEDGLADCADGFGGAFGRDRKLAIMRDSSIGAFGVLALVCVTGLKAGLLAGLPGPGFAALSLIVAETLSRALIGLPALVLIQARSDGRASEAGRPKPMAVLAAFALAILTAFALLPPGPALLALAGGGLMTLKALLVARWQIGGVTGDVLGFTQSLAALGVLALVAMAPYDWWLA
ncbi:MAG: adenosylcobinamide-GDP ribazoletransferase [Rhodospirillales bacterium]